jgi:hypothetical protein
MDAAPLTIYTVWVLAALSYFGLCYHREKRRRRIMRSLQTAVRLELLKAA